MVFAFSGLGILEIDGDVEVDKFSKVLVTGGAGFIGSHLVDTLMVKNFDVKVVGN